MSISGRHFWTTSTTRVSFLVFVLSNPHVVNKRFAKAMSVRDRPVPIRVRKENT